MINLELKIENLRRHFRGGGTLSVQIRRKILRSLRDIIKRHEKDIIDALLRDLRKNPFESYSTEVGFVLGEIDHALKELNDWTTPRPVVTSVLTMPASSTIYPMPKGVVVAC